ncbi:hypothetical protein V6N13_044080 [Hibiscus sabdariffa]
MSLLPTTFPHPIPINTPTHVACACASPITLPPSTAIDFKIHAGCFSSIKPHPMATKLEETPVKGTSDDNKKVDKGDEELAKEIPPPPEKPEPGDCCGSGCVRCVWDVYYEELEAYNKLHKSDSMDSTSKF